MRPPLDFTAFAPPATCLFGRSASPPDREEWANSATHALGAVLSLAGLAELLRVARAHGELAPTLSAGVFGLSLCLLYAASALYHGVTNWRWKHWFQRCDYAGIFLLIAGTYTPILVLHLQNSLGRGLLAAVWILCGAGMVLSVFYRFPWRSEIASTCFYVALGWLAATVFRPLADVLPPASFRLLLLGGGCYTLGTVFFAWHRLPFHHAIWHLCVLAGSACHWFCIRQALERGGV
jgi:hemolysin III